MTSASSGTICTMRTITSTAVRKRNRKRATATAASSDSTHAPATVMQATVSELSMYWPNLASVST
jgi:hypothetical protein